VARDMQVCAERLSDLPQPVPANDRFQNASTCFQNRVGTTDECSGCFAYSILCSQDHCLEECACVSYRDKTCKTCMETICNNQSWTSPTGFERDFNYCSGIDAPFLQVSNTMNALESGGSNTYRDYPPYEDSLIV